MLAGFFPRNEASNGYSGVVPLGVAAHNIDGAIAALIDRGLRIHQRGETIPSLAEIRAALPDSRDGCFTGSQSESLWQKRFAAYTEKLRKKTAFRHFMRKQRTVLIGTAVAVAVVAGVGFSLAKDFGDRPTTAGLEPQEVVERFYQAVTEMDQGNVDACVTKGAGKVYISPMSSLYVVSKMREYYESQKTVLTPVEWFTEKMPEGISVFGVMDLTVTEIAVPSETASTRRASSADESAYLATFYFFNPGAPEESLPVITRHEDTLLLSRSKTGWRIYSLVQNRVSELSVEETEGLVGASLLGL
jgi:hypothetical protein